MKCYSMIELELILSIYLLTKIVIISRNKIKFLKLHAINSYDKNYLLTILVNLFR